MVRYTRRLVYDAFYTGSFHTGTAIAARGGALIVTFLFDVNMSVDVNAVFRS